MMSKIFILLSGVLLALLIAYFVMNPMAYSSKPIPKTVDIADELSAVEAPAMPVSVSVESTGNDAITKVSIGEKSEHKELKVRSHVYTIIHKEDDLKKLEYTLSYVLFPRNISGHSSKGTAIYKRYIAVLEQIQELRKINKSNIVAKSSPFLRTDNHFVLFKKIEEESRVTVENYNYELSYKVLDFFKEKYPDVRFDDEGPYIITTVRNVMNGAEDFSFLYMNLSNFNNSAIREAIESYKKRLVKKGNRDIEMLEGWRYSLLSTLTNFNDDIHIVRSAMAGDF
jgi:hypothetical protein